MSDSRVDKVMAGGDDTFVGYDGDEIEGIISGLESAGLVVIDPDDSGTLARIARALHDGEAPYLPMHSAVRVVGALRGAE